MKKLLSENMLLSILIPVWIGMFLLELMGYIFFDRQFFYRRAWEAVTTSASGTKDSYLIPFKPHSEYRGIIKRGDLTSWFFFKPYAHDQYEHIFLVDEYGFRNQKGLYDSGVEAVLLGNSNIGGAQENQKNLVSEILTNTYHIPTYNYALKPLQLYWQDARFIEKPPRYVIVLGPESEILSNNWIMTLTPSDTRTSIKKWNSYKEWEEQQTISPFSSLQLLWDDAYFFSVGRIVATNVYIEILNRFFSRSQLALLFKKEVADYDERQDMIFFDYHDNNPLYTKARKQQIDTAIQTLVTSRDILASRGSTLIVAVFPGKPSLYYQPYKHITRKQNTLVHLERALERENIEHVKFYDLVVPAAKEKGELFYYKEDTHWNSKANRLISRELAQKITELSQISPKD